MNEINYELMLDGALRGVVRDILTGVAEHGLPGDHHFFVTFDTTALGVNLSPTLRQRYPDEMTIVLQHQFWNLVVGEDRFGVTLRFSGTEERIEVPWGALTVFADPSREFGLQLRLPEDLAAERDQADRHQATGPFAIPGPVSHEPVSHEPVSHEPVGPGSLSPGPAASELAASEADPVGGASTSVADGVEEDVVPVSALSGGKAEVVRIEDFRRS